MLKHLLIISGLISIFIFVSCTKEDRKEVKQTIDSASQKLGHELDTVINTKLNNDSLFNNAPVETINGAALKSKEFRSALNDIFDKYEDIKDDLADDDTSGARESADELSKILKNTQTYAPAAEMDRNWKLWLGGTERITGEFTAAALLSEQRKKFTELSGSMESLVKQFGLDKRTIYKLNCNALADGIFWLSDTKELDNPYTGKDKTNGRDEKCVKVIKSWKFE